MTYHLPDARDVYSSDDRPMQQAIDEARNNQHKSPCFSFILGSFSNYLMVYKDVQLIWTAKTSSAPIFVDTGKFGSQDGLIVSMADNGYLQVSYLGTEAPANQNALNLPESKDSNYEQMNIEH